MANEKISVSDGATMERPPHRYDDELKASVRIISTYDIGTDSILSRFDVLVNAEPMSPGTWRTGMKGDQFNAAIFTKSLGASDFMIPDKGIEGVYTFKAAPSDLSAMFRAFADAIDAKTSG